MTPNDIRALLNGYDHLLVECDGFTRIATYLLAKHRVPHTVWLGKAWVGDHSIVPHFWITLPDGHAVDYRLRMWAGPKAPHGVFLVRDTNVVYDGKAIEMPVPDIVFEVLTQSLTGA